MNSLRGSTLSPISVLKVTSISEVYDSSYPTGKVAVSMLFNYDGSLASGRIFNNKTDPSENIINLPEGSEVKACHGVGYKFIKPMHSTSEDHIIGVQTK